MKNMKRALALLLVLCLLLSCVAYATPGTEGEQVVEELNSLEGSALDRGVFSKEFRESNPYRYTADQIVRAIVLLEGAPEADFEGTEEQRSAYTIKLKNAQRGVRKAMTGVKYELQYEFTTLLNGFSCDVAYGDLENIAKIPGVSAVHIANTYAEPVMEKPENACSNVMMGNNDLHKNGYNGKGIVVAVLDTGLRTTHEAFKVYKNMALTQTLTASSIGNASVSGKYLSAKVPFAYDYADKDNNVDDKNGHGTHVSGTAVGYAESSDGAVILSGGAPAAQLVSMKIFKDEGGGTSSDIYFYALEDAYRLGVDVVNMSIGAQNGFTYDSELETDVFGNIYKHMEEAGIVMCVAAGNEYSMEEFSSVGYIGTEYTDFGSIASPAAYEGNISVAAVQNYAYPDYYIQVSEKNLPFNDGCEDGTHGWVQTFGGKTLGVVVLKTADGTDLAYGYESDYASVYVKDKIVVVSRGDLSFQDKVDYAANAGAAGLIVCNNVAGNLGMVIDPYPIPAVAMTIDAREIFLALSSGSSVTVSKEKTFIDNPTGYEMCAFSNWGTSPMLTIDPTITAVGGMVYSASIDGDNVYEVMSGTSMASPNAAGSFACMLQFLKENDVATDTKGNRRDLTKVERLDRAVDLMASTGILLQDSQDYVYSVRKQGAGLVNTVNATNTFMDGAYISNPIQELGDDKNKTGVYTMELELVNEGYNTVTYDKFNTYILYDTISQKGDHYAHNLYSGLLYQGQQGNATVTYKVDGKAVDSITLQASQRKTVTVEIALDSQATGYYDKFFPNGAFVEGYVSFSHTVPVESEKTAPETHASFLAYYGDWLQAPALESLNSFHYLQALYALNNETLENGKTYGENGYTEWDVLLEKFGRFYTDINWVYTANSKGETVNYLGANIMDKGNTAYNSAYHAISTPSTNADYASSMGMVVIPNLLRNVRHIVMKVTDKKTGTVYYTDDTEYLPKDMYDEENSRWKPLSNFEWKGTKADGKTYVPSGTEVTVSFDIQLPYGVAENIWHRNAWTFDMTVDYTAPIIESAVYDATAKTLTICAKDETYLAGIYLCSTDYKTLYGQKTLTPTQKGESFEVVFDVSKVDVQTLYAVAVDYATNEREQQVKLDANAKPAVLTLVTAEGTQTKNAYMGEIITLPSANSYNSYQFSGWVANPVSNSSSKPSTVYASGSSYTLNAQSQTLYALYGKTDGTPAVTYTREQTDNWRGQWAIVGYPFDSGTGGAGAFKADEPLALGKDLETVDISTLSDGLIYEGANKFGTQAEGISYTLTYYSNYSAYAICNDQSGTYLTAYEGELLALDQIYLQGLWKFTKGSNGSVICTNHSDSNAILLYNDSADRFQVFDKTVAVVNGYYPTDFYFLYMYRRAENTVKIEYYTTALTLCQINGHSYDAVTIAPGCESIGYTTYTCTVCGYSYIYDRVQPTGHSYEAVVTDPTCTTQGYTTYTCTSCGHSYVGDEIQIPGHSYDAVVTEPTCTVGGYTTYTCTVCGDSYVGDLTEKLDHSYEETVKEPTCTNSGAVIYTCSACGDSYTSSIIPATGHSYVYTDLGDSHYRSCPDCGRSATVAHSYEDGLCVCGKVLVDLTVYHTLDLASDISVNFAVNRADVDALATGSYLVCSVPVYQGNVLTGTQKIRVESELRKDLYYYTLTGLDATMMNDTVSVELYGTVNGASTLLTTDEYSVATYAYSQLGKNTAPESLKALCANLLRYGAKAQIFKEYRTDALADYALTAQQQAYLTELEAVTFGNVKTEAQDCPNVRVAWAGRGLDLQSKVAVKFIVDCSTYTGDVTKLSLRISYVDITGERLTLTVKDPQVYIAEKNYYAFTFDGLLAAELRSVLSAAVYIGGVQISNTATYSPDTYGNGKSGDLLTLCQALFAYSDCAKAYFTAQ